MSFATAYGVKKRMGKSHGVECMAEGGEVKKEGGVYTDKDRSLFDAQHEQLRGFDDVHDIVDMVGKIMQKRYSQGGMVANDVGVAAADELPAEYDDLVLRDDLEDNSGPGNEIGDPAQDERDTDVVSKILASRKKKDRMPRPA